MESLLKLNRIVIMFIAVCFRYVPLFFSSTLFNYFLLFLLFILTLFNILNIKFKSTTFRKITILFLLSSLIFIFNNEDNLFIYLVAALAFLSSDNRQTIKYFFIFSLLSFALTIISGQVGLIETVTAGRYIDNETVYRNSLGFGNVNTPFIYFLGIMFGLYYFLRDNRKKLFFVYIITTIIALWMFKETDCRTGFYLYLLFIFFSFFYNEKMNNKIKEIVPYLFIIFTILSILMAVFFGRTFDNPINSLLSSRPYFSYYYLEHHAYLSLFGTGVVGSYVLDNYYLSLLVKMGMIGYFTYLYLFFKGGQKIKNDYKLVLILFFTLLYGVLECNLYGNFIYLILIKNVIGDDKNA